MATLRKSDRQNPVFFRSIYALDLARGSSHIASALSAVTQRIAIDDVVREFRQRHTGGDLAAFLQLLAEGLDDRGKIALAAIIRAMA